MKKHSKKKQALKGRYGPEMQQEDVSIPQIMLWLRRWHVGQFAPRDLGEDLIVRIFGDDNNWTGLSFHLQAKSTTSLATMLAKSKKGQLGYKLDVHDLLHWEDGNPPVLVVVWDINMNEGRWQDVPSILAALDSSGKAWRKQKSVVAPIPIVNRTDADSKVAIRHRIAQLASPLFANRQLEGDGLFSFPQDTEEGRRATDEFRRTMDEGGECVIPGKFVDLQVRSPWFSRLHGTELSVESVKIGSAHSEEPLRLHLIAVGPMTTEAIPVDLKVRKAGRRQATFDNHDDPNALITLSVICEGLDKAAPGVIRTRFAAQFTGRSLPDLLRLVRFFRVLHVGGRVYLGGPDGRPWGETGQFRGENLPSEAWLQWFEAVLLKLSFVQSKIKEAGHLDLSNGFGATDERVLDELHSLYAKGYWEIESENFEMTMSRVPARLTAEDLAAKDSAILFRLPPQSKTLLGLKIPLGPVLAEVRDCSNLPMAVDEAAKTGSNVIQLGEVVIRHSLLPGDSPDESGGAQPSLRASSAAAAPDIPSANDVANERPSSTAATGEPVPIATTAAAASAVASAASGDSSRL